MAVHYKKIIKMEMCARYESLGLKDSEIALLCGYDSVGGLAAMKQDPDYPLVRTRIKTGFLTAADEKLFDNLDYLRERIKSHVPHAIEQIAKALDHPDAKIRLNAASEILDREGSLAKVSRIGIPTEAQGGLGRIDTTAADGLVTSLTQLQAKKGVQLNVQYDPINNATGSAAPDPATISLNTNTSGSTNSSPNIISKSSNDSNQPNTIDGDSTSDGIAIASSAIDEEANRPNTSQSSGSNRGSDEVRDGFNGIPEGGVSAIGGATDTIQ